MYFIYFIQSLKNNKVYVGFTSKDIKIRLYEHNKDTNSWTVRNKPFKLVYYESYHCEQDARARERFYKMGFGKQIKKIIIKTIIGL